MSTWEISLMSVLYIPKPCQMSDDGGHLGQASMAFLTEGLLVWCGAT